MNEIRSYRMPPPAVNHVLCGVLMLMGEANHTWSNIKAFLGQPSVKEQIINFDARQVSPKILQQTEAIIKANAASFEHARIYQVNRAAAPLAAWTKANIQYARVCAQIAPLADV